MRKLTLFFATILIMAFAASCTWQKEEDLVSNIDPCDTALVSYATHIAPIMAASCNACHSSGSPLGGVNTSNYTGLSVVAAAGSLIGAVNHASGYKAMPQGQPKLDSCSLKRINAWVNKGFPNN
jgi:mono/diheme cytochrome c family protein